MDKHIAQALVSGKFQIMIPKKIKDMLDVEEGDYILFFEEDGKVFVDTGKLVRKYVSLKD
jgi:AbrB family looped-hinge helix DNA binding protein